MHIPPFKMFDLSYLNKEQQEAVQTTEGAVLVLAGAGTGKTRVLTSRIAYIVHSGLSELSEVLSVTFTNKAAKEMKERTLFYLSQNGYRNNLDQNLWIGTFHSLALRMIRPHCDLFNRSSNFSIIDSDDQLRIIKKILQEHDIDDKKHTPKQIAYYINTWKDQCRNPEDVLTHGKFQTTETIASKIYKHYQNTLDSLDAIDFGDILKVSIELFKKHPDILEKYQSKFKYIMVDEYQDTNSGQYVWLRLLSKKTGNICCVGDDDQSIYGWRGADIENILRFDKDFKGTKIIRLGQNYRSTKNILNVASKLISNNSKRMKKEFWTDESSGLPVIVKALHDPGEEANFIASLIENKHNNGIRFSEIAVLVRGAFQTRVFEERMLAVGIPYTVIGGIKFYERKEVKDAIAYLKLVINDDDGISFERIVNLPKRGIGITSINKLYEIARTNNTSLPKAARWFSENYVSNTAFKLKEFFDLIDNFKQGLNALEPYELMQVIIEKSGYLAMLRETKTIENEARIENLEELVNAIKEFESIHDFLDYISLVLDNTESVVQDKVTISTIHAAKGLEYHTVFIPGFEEGIMPHQKSIAEKGDIGIEEERRLCYVAITRGRKEVYITLCNRRNMFGGSYQYVTPSRFLYDLPKGSIKIL